MTNKFIGDAWLREVPHSRGAQAAASTDDVAEEGGMEEEETEAEAESTSEQTSAADSFHQGSEIYRKLLMSQKTIPKVMCVSAVCVCTYMNFKLASLARLHLIGEGEEFRHGQQMHFYNCLCDGWVLNIAFRINSKTQTGNRLYFINLAAILPIVGGGFHPIRAPVLEVGESSPLASTITSKNGGMVVLHYTGGFKFQRHIQAVNVITILL